MKYFKLNCYTNLTIIFLILLQTIVHTNCVRNRNHKSNGDNGGDTADNGGSVTMKHHQNYIKSEATAEYNNDLFSHRRKIHRKRHSNSKFTIEELLNLKVQQSVSNDRDMDPDKSGGFMGDIILPDINYDNDVMVADAPSERGDSSGSWNPPIKYNKTVKEELEILKQEVYNEGLQVEEEGLTDIIRKKTKLPSSITDDEPLKEPRRNDAALSLNEPVKSHSENDVISSHLSTDGLLSQSSVLANKDKQIFPVEIDNFQPKISIRDKPVAVVDVLVESNSNYNNGVVSRSESIPDEKFNKTIKTIPQHDHRKIQSNTKDIEDDSGNNFVSEGKSVILTSQSQSMYVTTTTTTIATPRSTKANIYSNSGGNGMRLEDIEYVHSQGAVRRRHIHGRKFRRSSKTQYKEKLERLKRELNGPAHFLVDQVDADTNTIGDDIKRKVNGNQNTLPGGMNIRVTPPHVASSVLKLPSENAENVFTKLNYSSEKFDKFEVLTKRKATMDAINAEIRNITKFGMELQSYEKLKKLKKHHRITRAVTAKKERVWDYGVIPYEVDGNFSGQHKALFKQAMRHWEEHTCIKFVERDPELHDNYIVFTVRPCGCCSFVGKRGNGPQAISIGKNCDKFGIVVHELGHVVGFWHEHTRPDRDRNVVINKENIMQGQSYNFNKLTDDDVDSLGMSYDYNSIMHYARNTFSKFSYLDTILPLDRPNIKRPEIGQRVQLSEGDIAQAKLLYKCPMCGRTFQENTGSFWSPSYYNIDASNETERCEWRITATNGEKIVLNFENLNIFKSDNCQTDYLEVRDGYYVKSPLIGRFCGKVKSETLITRSSRMLLTYVNSHREKGYNGFKANFEAVCGGELSVDETGFLESPNYPLEYLANKECIWKITVPEGYQVALKFQSFEVENHDTCAYDYVEVRDGDSDESPIIGVFCGYKSPPHMKSSGNTMFIKFVSDSSVKKAGFSAVFMKEVDECESANHGCEHKCTNTLGGYECSCNIGYELHSDKKHCEDACGGIIEAMNGTITSPSFPDKYPILKNCIWEIIAPPRYKISLNFTHFDLEGSSTQIKEGGCGYDYVSIHSKLKNDQLKYLDAFCGMDIPPVVTSEGNILHVEFHSDKSVQKTGFAAIFQTDVDECLVNNGGCQHECRNTIGSYTCSCHNGYTLHDNGHDCKEGACKYEVTAPFGNIYSPNYPDFYPPNLDCVWHFTVTPGHRIKLIFNEFDVESHQECTYDHVSIYDGNSQNSSILGIFCSDKIPFPISSATNELYMVFQTDKNKPRNGFSATHSTACGGFLKAKNYIQHFFSHARFGHMNYDENMNCEWRIQAENGRNVQLDFLTFELESTINCTFDFLEVYSGEDDISGPSYGRLCGSELPADIISLSDTLIIHFETDNSMSMKGFSISYVAVDPFDENESYGIVSEEDMATPFPGSLKNIYYKSGDSIEEYDEYDDYNDNKLNLNLNLGQKRLKGRHGGLRSKYIKT